MTKEEAIIRMQENFSSFHNDFIDGKLEFSDITEEEKEKLELLTNLSYLFPYISLSIFIKDILKLEDRLENLNVIDDDDGNKFIEEKECFFSLIEKQDFFKERFVGMEDYRRLEQSKTDIEEQFKKTKRIEQEKNSKEDNNAVKAKEDINNVVNNTINRACKIIEQSISNTINGHEYVDLGLPSGLKWATCNVGADSPEKYGDYYAWGETTMKSSYTKQNSFTNGIKMSDFSGDSTYDVAKKKWGKYGCESTWRMPTMREMIELVNCCTWIKGRYNGVNGFIVKGGNGNSIFLPAAGCISDDTYYSVGDKGYYWSSVPSSKDCAYYLYFTNVDGSEDVRQYCRYGGYPVRPVSE